MSRAAEIEVLHLVEPTLVDQTGHCASFIAALCAAGPEQRFQIWAGRAAEELFPGLPQAALQPYFGRRLRRAQAFWLYRRLLRAPGRLFVPTAGVTDIQLLSLAAPARLPADKASLFVHWIRPTDSRRRRLARAARRQPELRVLAPTDEIVALLRDAGFARARLVPYPLSPRARAPETPAAFRHLLFAGAARLDKGFSHVVDLVEQLERSGEEIRLCVQTSSRHYGKVDSEIARELARLERIRYRGLATHPQTLDAEDYFGLFRGAICLQPYQRAEFEGRVSAVTVDALACGAPILTTAGTWIARTVERLNAGLALEKISGDELLLAARRVIADYPRYSANALEAARVVHREHDPSHLLSAVLAPDSSRAAPSY